MAKTADAVPQLAAKCSRCKDEIFSGYCDHCHELELEGECNSAWDEGHREGIHEVSVAAAVREWTSRAKLLYGYTSEVLDVLERCAQEMEDSVG